ncbi:LysR substrate-binding domain-containing protein [Nannocystis sp. ILAH1]|uniref:LysR family transcriptional regulator n=1 Tax=unclassified Nannocystis TaxID=2627009 RepID=UPI00227187F4|nr:MULTISPECIES: LysR substrate-binding domain-containing protein [unclassified Nannocystis]MCY0988679.1 LysR substrate-binding domain-containing protein [Nannocystis sp. ILAH1]MCY1072456.1 LysR substrate-binding domain-containing protein [Nannocystis sp. RBIL2]
MVDELRHFLLIIELGTFTEAARRAHLSQPALTASIQRLEGAFGARLLDRGPGGATPTAAGTALVTRARAVLAALDDAKRAVAEIEGLHAGEVRVGAGATACTYLLPPTLALYRAEHPGVRFLLREANTDEVLDALHRGDLDLGVITTDRGEPWFVDELILVAAPELPDPTHAPFVTFARGTTSRELLERHFPSAEIVMELGSIASVKGNVRAGIGVALISRASARHDLSHGRLIEVPDPRTPIARPLHLVHRGIDRLPPAAARLRELLLAHPPDRPPVRRAS